MTEIINSENPPLDPQPPPPENRIWPVKALGWLFLLQAVVLLGNGLIYFLGADILPDLERLLVLSPNGVLEGPQISIIFNFALIPLAILVLVAAVGFFRSWPTAWLYAMLSQGLILAMTLLLYFYDEPDYLAMVTSTFLVLYLNYADGQANLQGKSIRAEEEGLS